ncbi:CU044_5270 family protein [Nonomuraea turcica]|uniref:CU044_5270 family protein n=1 Tax=Nonomuraea sp. G32 TaxID=3067274 RepID=UPI00273B496D|nr:CU044_5270 family protein [Nonomuraea sp. G32]MDP4510966.1 CU044_5270 family protein [Nonomuraea sp. G32]
MDDLTILGEMRADAPEPDAVRLRRLRRRVMRRRRRFVIMPSVLVAAVAVVVVAVSMAERPPAVRTLPAVETVLLNSKTVLEKAAKTVEKRADAPEPRPDQWQYTKILNLQPADGRTATYESWLRYDGKQTAGRDAEGNFRVQDVPPDPGDDDLSPQQYRQKLLKLPTDPDKLLAHVQGDRHWVDYPKEEGVPKSVEDPDTRAYRILSLYLKQQAVMPPELEAAIFRAMAKIPGVEIEQGVTDATGRTGLGLFRSTIGEEVQRRYLILDPRTYRVMADQSIWLGDELFKGEVVFRKGAVYADVWLESGIVDKPGDVR